MLQQTQVATVIPYYERFLKKFPTAVDLAAADQEEVLRMWEGLGYYRRAKQMHTAAKVVVEKHDGKFPTDYESVLDLPGIGRYTAGAILSISKDQKLPVVEANTVRLYSRLIALRDPPAKTSANRLLWEVAEAVLPIRGSGQFNQAAMELGALVCVPRDPDCPNCPLVKLCPTHEQGLQSTIPGRVKKILYESRDFVAVVTKSDDKYFMRQCGPGQHWAGLWDFPRYDVTDCERDVARLVEQKFSEEYGFNVSLGENLPTIKHGVTKYRITLRSHLASTKPRLTSAAMTVRESSDRGWFTLNEIAQLPLNTTGRKLADHLQNVTRPATVQASPHP